jgi:hypothetical protein
MRHAWESGIPLARWLPDLAFGYGYPFFIFREGPPLYLVLFPHMVGLPLPAALNLFYIICILASGWFMYLWVRDIFGPRSGIVSAVAYMAAPYLLIDALIRGNQPESMALALFPLILWAGRRFILKGQASAFLVASLALALLALSHNISIFLFVPFLFIYLVGVGWSGQMSWKPLTIRLLLLFGLGLGLAAFYLGPALFELDEITISQSVSNRNNDFRFNFASLGEIFSPVTPADPSLLNPPLLLRLGWIPVLLSLLGLASLKWVRARERRGHIIFMALSTGALLFMALPPSLIVWENLPLIEFVQFPWRFIGRAALPVAFLAGIPFAYIPDKYRIFNRSLPLAPLLTMAAAILLIVESVPNLDPHTCPEVAQPPIYTVHAYEHNSGLVGVDPAGSYFPKSVKTRPLGSSLEEDYLAGRIPQRFDTLSLPPGALIRSVDYTSLSGQMDIESPSPFQVRYLSFAYPGWEATIDGERVSISASDPEGLITFPVPAGEHTIEVSWQMTSSRAIMAGISVAAAVSIVIVSVYLFRKGTEKPSGGESANGVGPSQEESSTDPDSPDLDTIDENTGRDHSRHQLNWLGLSLLVVTGISLLVFKLLVVDPGHLFLRQEKKSPVTFGSGIVAGELLLDGYNLSQDAVEAGKSFDIDLAWRVLEPPEADYQSNVWIVGPERMIWSDKETRRPRTYEDTARSLFWQPGQWAWDSREIEVFEGAPPGRYDIVLLFFDRDTLQPLTLIGQDGIPIGPNAVIGTVDVTVPELSPGAFAQFEIVEDIDGLTLLGYNQDRIDGSPGEPVLITLFWEKNRKSPPPVDLLKLVLVDDSGEPVQNWSIPPVRVDYPPEDWPTGTLFRGQHVLRLDPDLISGSYSFQLEDIELGQLRIGELDRLFDEPTYDSALNANFDNLAELVGVVIEPFAMNRGMPITVTIIWRGLQEMPVSYRVFVHLVNTKGEIVAQSDAEPAGWTRPTTGWLPGEYIVDSHFLGPVPLGEGEEYTLRIGLYDPATGTRLTSSGEEFIIHDLETGGS